MCRASVFSLPFKRSQFNNAIHLNSIDSWKISSTNQWCVVYLCLSLQCYRFSCCCSVWMPTTSKIPHNYQFTDRCELNASKQLLYAVIFERIHKRSDKAWIKVRVRVYLGSLCSWSRHVQESGLCSVHWCSIDSAVALIFVVGNYSICFRIERVLALICHSSTIYWAHKWRSTRKKC